MMRPSQSQKPHLTLKQRLVGPSIIHTHYCDRENPFELRTILEAAHTARYDPRAMAQIVLACPQGVMNEITESKLETELQAILTTITIKGERWHIAIVKHLRYESFAITMTTTST